MMACALFPFAVSLGFNAFVAMESFADIRWAGGLSLVVTALALWFWFALEWLAVQKKREEPHDQMLTEARVILPCAQAVLGFQLAVVLARS